MSIPLFKEDLKNVSSVNPYSVISPEIQKLSDIIKTNDIISPELYVQHDVKRGLRDINGKGVRAGLTDISTIVSTENGVPCEGQLYYRGYNIEDIVKGFTEGNRFGFEEVSYLLLFGSLPTSDQLNEFKQILAGYCTLPQNFVRDVIMKKPSRNAMNALSRSVLTLYSYDDNPDETSIANVLRQSLQIISQLPMLAIYAYRAYKYYYFGKSLIIHSPKPGLSCAENMLRLLRSDKKYTELEAKILDMCLVLHAEHGGGNNSTFTTHVVTSSGTDTYSSVAASLGSLKGPKHGGANIKVVEMINDIKKNVSDWTDEGEIKDYLAKILNKEAFDKSGLIYGMGHAVYSLSDPRAKILKKYVTSLSEEKGKNKEFALYCAIEKLAPEVIAEKRSIYKGVSANVDFYSGFVYSMLELPAELYTPIFAVARIVGWSAHRLEELNNAGKIIRPAYVSISENKKYIDLENRD